MLWQAERQPNAVAGHVVSGKVACLEAWRTFFAAFPDYRNHFESFTSRGVDRVRGRPVVVLGGRTLRSRSVVRRCRRRAHHTLAGRRAVAAPLNHAWPATRPPVSNRGHSTRIRPAPPRRWQRRTGRCGRHSAPPTDPGRQRGRPPGGRCRLWAGCSPAAPGGGAGPSSIRGSGRSAGRTVRAGLTVPDRGARAAAVGIAAGVLLGGRTEVQDRCLDRCHRRDWRRRR